jgi:asparagine synthase (glutamine-hydrolysing)
MCGIAGFYRPGGLPEAAAGVLEAMTTVICHRGPDDSGAWLDGDAGVALGHRRLSILDLSPLGHQPMQCAGGRYAIVFNGEIYNFKELRHQLEGLGHRFRGSSDTEVMLAGISEWEVEGALERFNGMFAFAVWDRAERALHLARDRGGEKPLYYGWMNGTLLFGSELKSLRRHPDFRADLDRDALALYLRHNYVPTPYTIFRGVHKLPAGTVLTVRAEHAAGTAATPRPYWSMREVAERGLADPFTGSDEAAIEELDRLLKDAVRLRMEADVPLGAFLSGGVDSSVVVALMQVQSDRPVKTFTIGFYEEAYDEAKHAAAVARHLGTEHTELYVPAEEARSVIPLLPTLYDEPFSDSSQIPTYLVSALARRHVTVSFPATRATSCSEATTATPWDASCGTGLTAYPPRSATPWGGGS